jgi:hypothetical protein
MVARITQVGLPLIVAIGVAYATIVLVRVGTLPRTARRILGVVGAYGTVAFLQGGLTGASLVSILAGQGFWHALPYAFQGAVLGGFVVLPLAVMVSAIRIGLRSPVKGSRARAIRQTAALATVLAIVVAELPRPETPIASPVATTASTTSTHVVFSPERLATLENSFRAIEDGEKGSPRDRWDPDYVVQHLGRDPEVLFEWVRDNTWWIPYRGVLRGPTGVLMDRLGNSLDRALLLATLLQKAGHTVRLAHAELPRPRADEILPGLISARDTSSDTPQLALDSEVDLQTVAGEYQLDPAKIQGAFRAQAAETQTLLSKLDTRVTEQTRKLLAMVGPGAQNDRTKRFDDAIEALRDHWWVQRGNDERWLDLDVLNPGPTGGDALVSASEILDVDSIKLPHHEITIRIVAEQRLPDRLLERTVLEHTLRPSAIIGQSVAIRFWPLEWPADVTGDNREAKSTFKSSALDQHTWAASVVVGRDVVAKAKLNDSGDVEALVAPGPMAGLGGRVAAVLEQRTQEPPLRQTVTLTAVWVEYEIRSSAEPSRRVRRVLFDLLGAQARTAHPSSIVIDDTKRLTRSLSLMRETQVLPVVCRFAPEFLGHLVSEGLLANRDVLRSAVRGDVTETYAQTLEFRQRVSALPTPLYSLALARLEWGRFANELYVDRPVILTRHLFPVSESGALRLVDATDIVLNDVGVALNAKDSFAIRLEQGVLDTNAEALLQPRASTTVNTAEAFAVSDQWVVLAAADHPKLEHLHLPEDARRQLAADVAAGFIVIAPRSPVRLGSEDFIGWWRIDAVTGQALGIDRNGWGSSMVKYAFVISVMEGFVIGWTFDFLMCKGTFQPPRETGSSPNVNTSQLRDLVENPVLAAEQDPCWLLALIGGVAGSIFAMLGRVVFGRFMRVPEFLRRLRFGGGGKPPALSGPGSGGGDVGGGRGGGGTGRGTSGNGSAGSGAGGGGSTPGSEPPPGGGGSGRGRVDSRACDSGIDPLGKTDPALGGPPTKISPQGEPGVSDPPPQNPNDIKAPKNPNPGANPELQKARYEDLKRRYQEAFNEYREAEKEARAAEAEWWQAREKARSEGRPDPPMPNEVKRTTTNVESKARAEDDLKRAMNSAKEAVDIANRNAARAAEDGRRARVRQGDTLPSGEPPPTPHGTQPPQGAVVPPCAPGSPDSAKTIPGHQTLVGINGVQTTLAGIK